MQGWFQRAPVFKGPSYQGDEAKTPEVCTTMQKIKQQYIVLEYFKQLYDTEVKAAMFSFGIFHEENIYDLYNTEV